MRQSRKRGDTENKKERGYVMSRNVFTALSKGKTQASKQCPNTLLRRKAEQETERHGEQGGERIFNE